MLATCRPCVVLQGTQHLNSNHQCLYKTCSKLKTRATILPQWALTLEKWSLHCTEILLSRLILWNTPVQKEFVVEFHDIVSLTISYGVPLLSPTIMTVCLFTYYLENKVCRNKRLKYMLSLV